MKIICHMEYAPFSGRSKNLILFLGVALGVVCCHFPTFETSLKILNFLGGGFLDFSDRAEDLDSLEIGGEVTFQEPYDLSNAAQRNIGVSRSGEGGDDRTLEVGFHHLGVRLDG